MAYSSLQAFDELVASGVPEPQARAMIRVQEQSAADHATNHVTKGDLDNMSERMERLFWRAIAIQSGISITIAVAAVTIAEVI